MASIKKPIGIFDSGIGGLTVLKKLQRMLPHEHFVYFADTANMPYGEKTPQEIMSYTRAILSWMQDTIGVKLAIAACHTSSAIALDHVCQEFSIPVVGTIHPMIKTILHHHQDRRIGIIATPTSVNSKMHEDILVRSGFTGVVHSIACPSFVPIIESGRLSSPQLFRNAREYLSVFKEMNLSTLIYGCTHYPWIADIIQDSLPSDIDCIDPTDPIVTTVSQWLYKEKMLNTSNAQTQTDFYCSHYPERFSAQLNFFMSLLKANVTFVSFEEANAPHKKIAINQ